MLIFAVSILFSGTNLATKQCIHSQSKLNWPNKIEYFIGRDQEISNLTNILESDIRIVIIVGMPGVGKSTLAIHMANVMSSRGMNIHFVDLYQVFNLNGVCEKILQRTDVTFQARPSTEVLQWAGGLDVKTLLVLDNCDDILHDSASRKEFQILVKNIFEASTSIKVVLTAKELIVFLGKFESIQLMPLSTGSAVELLQKINPKLTINEMHKIADLVGNMPLALQVIGALLHLPMPPDASTIINKLRKEPIPLLSPEELPKIQQIRTSIHISYTYLTHECQIYARLLANFPFPFSETAALDVAKPWPGSIEFDTQRCIRVLLQRSMLVHNAPTNHFQFHRLIKEYLVYAQKRNGTVDENEVRHFRLNFEAYVLNVITTIIFSWNHQPRKENWRMLDTERQNIQVFWLSLSVNYTVTTSTRKTNIKAIADDFLSNSVLETGISIAQLSENVQGVVDIFKHCHYVITNSKPHDYEEYIILMPEFEMIVAQRNVTNTLLKEIQYRMFQSDFYHEYTSVKIGKEKAIHHFTDTLLLWHKVSMLNAKLKGSGMSAAEVLELRHSRVLELYSHISNSSTRQYLFTKFYSALATAYILQNQHEKFMNCWREILHHSKPLGLCEHEKCSHTYLGLAYYGLEQYDNCTQYLEVAWKLNEGHLSSQARYLVILHYAYKSTGHIAKADSIVGNLYDLTEKLLARYHGINAKTYRTHAILASFFNNYNTKWSKQLAKDLKHHVMKHIMRPKKVIYPFEDVKSVLSILNLPEKIYYQQLYLQSILNSMHVNI